MSTYTIVNDAAGTTAATGAGNTSANQGHASKRLLSLDAYRGLIMISLGFNGFGLAVTATKQLELNPESSFWETVRYQFSHVEWGGCAYWDLIQPSFMFMVGVSLAYSYAAREQRGESYGKMYMHAVTRSLVLIFLGIFLISNWQDYTEWSLMNVLSQIGLGYTFLFLLWKRHWGIQLGALLAILGGTWLAYTSYDGAGLDPTLGDPDRGVPTEWAQQYLHQANVPSAWHKNANVGHAVDLVVLNKLPRKEEFIFNGGGYQTINFIPSLATMLVGLMCGELLRRDMSGMKKLIILVIVGGVCLEMGWFWDHVGGCPLVKRIWTPSWALFSSGWCCLLLAGFYGIIDVLGLRMWSFPLTVVGMNSIAMYCMGQLLKPWTAHSLKTHISQDLFLSLGEVYEPFVQATLVGLVFWLICFWMYKQRIFVRI
ncbi:MAG: acyltransferase family protein [Planctomycetaceae bacterium]